MLNNDKKDKKDNKENKNKPNKSPKNKNCHAGHRKNMRKKYLKNGFDSIELHEFVEILLYYPLTRINTNEIAHELTEKFHNNFSEIIEANESLLKSIKGISENTIFFLRLIADCARLYNIDLQKSRPIFNKRFHEDYLIAYYTAKTKETSLLICLNSRFEKISENIINIGDVNSANVDSKKVLRITINNNASSVILAHNHPDGTIEPSIDDIKTTRHFMLLFAEAGINFVDHYIIAKNEIAGIRDKVKAIF